MKNSIRILASASLVILLGAAGPAFAEATADQAQAQTTKPGSNTPVGTSGAATPARNAASTEADYRLVAGDKLRIEVFKDERLSQTLQIRPDGKITLPQVGDVPAAGRTSSELRDAIAGSLKESHENPLVTVIVLETVPASIYVMGEVKNPGSQSLRGDLTVLQALASAGGFTDWAKKKINILRKSPTGITTSLKFDYKDAIRGIGKPITLAPGDTIIVE